ncbi:MAG: MlaD family protein [Planctomycetota bacterium]
MHRLRYLIGLLTLAAAVYGSYWIVRLLRQADERPGTSLTVEFRNARGLRAGSDVRYRGVTVGSVRSVAITSDGRKAVAQLLIEPAGASHATVDSTFWIVRPRFSGLADGATGLDTLVRDSYVQFYTPAESGSLLTSGSLLAGSEVPPEDAEPEALQDIQHGDLLMTLLVPENHGLKAGSAVIYRGMRTGDVRAVSLAASGAYVEVQLRIARRYRQTVTNLAKFWVARPYVSGALFSGFTVTDVSALLTPYISYYAEPGKGVLVQDGYRAAAQADRPEIDMSKVPPEALRRADSERPPATDDIVLVRITYVAIERDLLSGDDAIRREGTGVLFLDKAGRTVVVTARAAVDGSYTESDAWGDPEIEDEQIKVLLPDGSVLRAGRVWVDPAGGNLAALVLEDVRPDLTGTPNQRFDFAASQVSSDSIRMVRTAGPDGGVMADIELLPSLLMQGDRIGSAVLVEGTMIGVIGFKNDPNVRETVLLDRLPEDLRPR